MLRVSTCYANDECDAVLCYASERDNVDVTLRWAVGIICGAIYAVPSAPDWVADHPPAAILPQTSVATSAANCLHLCILHVAIGPSGRHGEIGLEKPLPLDEFVELELEELELKQLKQCDCAAVGFGTVDEGSAAGAVDSGMFAHEGHIREQGCRGGKEGGGGAAGGAASSGGGGEGDVSDGGGGASPSTLRRVPHEDAQAHDSAQGEAHMQPCTQRGDPTLYAQQWQQLQRRRAGVVQEAQWLLAV